MSKYNVRFYVDYEIEAPNESEALRKADDKRGEEMNSGWFTLDSEVKLISPCRVNPCRNTQQQKNINVTTKHNPKEEYMNKLTRGENKNGFTY